MAVVAGDSSEGMVAEMTTEVVQQLNNSQLTRERNNNLNSKISKKRSNFWIRRQKQRLKPKLKQKTLNEISSKI